MGTELNSGTYTDFAKHQAAILGFAADQFLTCMVVVRLQKEGEEELGDAV